jgi:tripartite ATP-independent transporter DctM subunit
VGALLGAISGTVAASVLAMGLISLPVMMRYGYDLRLATGVVAASGTIAQLIPPALVLIVLADQLGRSVGDMYAGAVGPALMQVALFLIFIGIVALVAPNKMPPLPPEALGPRGWPLYWRVLRGMVPSILLMFLVLGTIFIGLATPTEAAAMGAMGAILLAIVNRRFSWELLREAMGNTMRISAMVIYILIGATVFTLVFQGVDGSHWVEGLFAQLPGGQTGFLIVVNIFIFLLGFFLDFFEIAFIVVPLLAPVATKLDIDLVWFGVLLCVNLQTSFLSPPFGFALFYLRSIAPKTVLTRDIYLGAIPFICLQVLLVAIVIAWPESVTYFIDRGTGVDPATVTIEVPPAPEPEEDAVPIFR